MKKIRLIILAIIIAILLELAIFMHAASANTSYPTDQDYVNDYAQVLDPVALHTLNKQLHNFEVRTTDQVGVLTVHTTGNESIEEYAIHVTDYWKLGLKNKDNGILFVVAVDDHKMRIEVGRGLQDKLTDIQSKRILDDAVRPEFKAKNYTAGVTKGVTAILTTLDPTATEAASIASSSATLTTNGSDWVFGIIILIVFFIIIIFILVAVFSDSDGDGDGFGGAIAGGIIGDIASSISEGGDSDGGSGFSGGGGGNFDGGGSSSSW